MTEVSREAIEATQMIAVEISNLLTRFGMIPRGGFPGTLQKIEKIVQKAIDGPEGGVTIRLTEHDYTVLTMMMGYVVGGNMSDKTLVGMFLDVVNKIGPQHDPTFVPYRLKKEG